MPPLPWVLAFLLQFYQADPGFYRAACLNGFPGISCPHKVCDRLTLPEQSFEYEYTGTPPRYVGWSCA